MAGTAYVKPGLPAIFARDGADTEFIHHELFHQFLAKKQHGEGRLLEDTQRRIDYDRAAWEWYNIICQKQYQEKYSLDVVFEEITCDLCEYAMSGSEKMRARLDGLFAPGELERLAEQAREVFAANRTRSADDNVDAIIRDVFGYDEPKVKGIAEKAVDRLPNTDTYGRIKGSGNRVEIKEIIPPGSSHPVEVYTDGFAQINRGKIETFIRGKVELDVEAAKARFNELKRIKNARSGIFDADMDAEFSSLYRQLHNYQRSQEMSRTLNYAGIADTASNNRMIADNLLTAAREVKKGHTKIISYLSGTNGMVQVTSMWNISDDGTPYLATVILKPVK